MPWPNNAARRTAPSHRGHGQRRQRWLDRVLVSFRSRLGLLVPRRVDIAICRGVELLRVHDPDVALGAVVENAPTVASGLHQDARVGVHVLPVQGELTEGQDAPSKDRQAFAKGGAFHWVNFMILTPEKQRFLACCLPLCGNLELL